SGNIFSFLEDYRKNRTVVHKWIPQGNWKYSYSVATTWLMSFHVVREESGAAASLLQLFAFLNPDRISLEFLEKGITGLKSGTNLRALERNPLIKWLRKRKSISIDQLLKSVVSDPNQCAKALLVLERFSLIKWSRNQRIVTIHRLVQLVIKDEMSEADSKSRMTAVISL